jgi:hypothetical protein
MVLVGLVVGEAVRREFYPLSAVEQCPAWVRSEEAEDSHLECDRLEAPWVFLTPARTHRRLQT